MLADTEAKMISKKIIALACGLFVRPRPSTPPRHREGL